MQSTRNMRITNRTIILIGMALLLLLVLPIWSYSRSWNYYPSLSLLLVLAILASVFFRLIPRNL